MNFEQLKKINAFSEPTTSLEALTHENMLSLNVFDNEKWEDQTLKNLHSLWEYERLREIQKQAFEMKYELDMVISKIDYFVNN